MTDIQEIQNHLESAYKHPRNVSKTFRKISHTVLEISIYWSDISMEIGQLTDWHIRGFQNHLELMWKQPRNVSNKFQKDISYRTGYILYWHIFGKEGSQLTDWQTYQKLVGIQNYCTNIPGMSPKKSRYLTQIWRY